MLVGDVLLNKRTSLKDTKIMQPMRSAMPKSSRKEEKMISEIETLLECVARASTSKSAISLLILEKDRL